MSNKKEKIAILGGGVSAITAAFKITSEANWQDKYDITLYQMGWRIGGKGASGRNMEKGKHARIEEHGIHVWFGFYYNAFHAMRLCYEELDRPVGSPLATLEEAFHPHQYTAFAQEFEGKWTTWPVKTMALPGKVGEGWEPQDIMQALTNVVAWLLEHTEFNGHFPLFEKLESCFDYLKRKLGHKKHEDQLRNLHQLFENASVDDDDSHPIIIAAIELARSTFRKLTKPFIHRNRAVAQAWMMIDFALTSLLGIMQDELYKKGFDAANNENLLDWLKRHGASETTLKGPIIDSLYGGVFAYKDGDLAQPNVETGTVLRAGLTAVTCSKESFIWRMEAGMGDVVFGPYYEVLHKRGVKFKFFHKVEELVAEKQDDIQQITKIKLVEQVPIADGKEYDPLVTVNGLPCWPSAPKYDLFPEDVKELLIKNKINLESNWSNWAEIYPQKAIELDVGKDFDKVILGISVAGLADICPTLLEQNPAFKLMTEKISTVCTQATQTWANKDVRELGSDLFEKADEAPECLGYRTQAMDSWADVSYLAPREDWPSDNTPKDISYFCGVFNADKAPESPAPDYPISQANKVKADFITMLKERIGLFWPKANPEPGVFKWDWLMADDTQQGEARFDSQYWRANVDPSERYVQSTVGSSQYRLKTDESGFDNLYLTGDWIDNGFNMGCVESATISGLLTAQAVTGEKYDIPGVIRFK
ncbi:NAD(P)-binding protein [Catenovulum sp. SM1970]|uniref:NAD(P)-binding protein n=1 Tax=Marinifaba aquimaris TaxID=2741323 RepID=UPI0015736732|nr:NAD(P)-binding protein [Marinifaba aquimaris]NTS78730.1 NAD(P)-binding protein [Marinifaba aquimaris]